MHMLVSLPPNSPWRKDKILLILWMRTLRLSEAMIDYKMAPNLFMHCLGRCPPVPAQGLAM